MPSRSTGSGRTRRRPAGVGAATAWARRTARWWRLHWRFRAAGQSVSWGADLGRLPDEEQHAAAVIDPILQGFAGLDAIFGIAPSLELLSELLQLELDASLPRNQCEIGVYGFVGCAVPRSPRGRRTVPRRPRSGTRPNRSTIRCNNTTSRSSADSHAKTPGFAASSSYSRTTPAGSSPRRQPIRGRPD